MFQRKVEAVLGTDTVSVTCDRHYSISHLVKILNELVNKIAAAKQALLDYILIFIIQLRGGATSNHSQQCCECMHQ